jgi:hypothetical protein
MSQFLRRKGQKHTFSKSVVDKHDVKARAE